MVLYFRLAAEVGEVRVAIRISNADVHDATNARAPGPRSQSRRPAPRPHRHARHSSRTLRRHVAPRVASLLGDAAGATRYDMLPVISTIVMLRFFAWRQRTSMSAYFTNSLTPPIGLGLLASLSRREFPSVGQRVARSLSGRWPAALPWGNAHSRFKAINAR
jgi:hypothetical protein